MMKGLSYILLFFGSCISVIGIPPSQPLFPDESGEKSAYKRWRIPVLLAMQDGTLLAFCEGRVDGGGANGNIDVILRRSRDAGKTWGPVEVVADAGQDALVQFCPVLDKQTGTIWLLYARNVGKDTEKSIVMGSGQPSRIFLQSSKDNGKTWTQPKEMTGELTRNNWTWGGGAPAVGIQLKSGRLLIPAYHAVLPKDDEPPTYESHMVYSDDHGKNWKLGETVAPRTNENCVAERQDGSIYYTARSFRRDSTRPFPAQFSGWRTIADSLDGGISWGSAKIEYAHVDAPCQAFLHSVTVPDGQDPIWVLTQPAGPGRRNLVARISRDEGKTWPGFRRISLGSSEYSSIASLPDGQMVCLYEIWDLELRTNVIRVARFPLSWLLEDPVAPKLPRVKLKEVRKVEGCGEDHNAFTEMIRYNGKILLAFRKSKIGHGVYPDSEIIIKSSADEGSTWDNVYRFSVPDRDVRDPHFLKFKGQLFLYTGTWDARPLIKNKFQLNDHVGYTVASKDGKTWTTPRLLEGTHGHYIWSAATDGKNAYMCSRRVKNFVRTTVRAQRDRLTEQALLTSDDGWVWKFHTIVQPEYGDETDYRFEEDGTLMGLARSGRNAALIVRSQPPYKKFDRLALDRHIGGPMLMKWKGHYLAGGRNTLYGKRVCALYWLADDRLHPILELPSGGDCSYPGFVQLDKSRAMVSYYSSHEDHPRQKGKEPPSSIFVAELELDQ